MKPQISPHAHLGRTKIRSLLTPSLNPLRTEIQHVHHISITSQPPPRTSILSRFPTLHGPILFRLFSFGPSDPLPNLHLHLLPPDLPLLVRAPILHDDIPKPFFITPRYAPAQSFRLVIQLGQSLERSSFIIEDFPGRVPVVPVLVGKRKRIDRCGLFAASVMPRKT